jgi:preprotein translocase subunit SecG
MAIIMTISIIALSLLGIFLLSKPKGEKVGEIINSKNWSL